MDAITNLYLKELHNDNSTKEESLQLIEMTRAGDEVAREKLIKNYLLLVRKIAGEYMNSGVPLGDLIQEGNIGLITAIEKFDSTKGSPFSSCAKFWIKSAIIRNCIMKKRIVRLPESTLNLMADGRWKGIDYREFSLDKPNEEGDSLSETIADDPGRDIFAEEEEKLLKNKVENILTFINDRDSKIVKASFGIDCEKLEPEEIAEIYNLTTARVHQILRNSLKKMRETLQPSTAKGIEILSAHYGIEGNSTDVTEKVISMHSRKESIKSGNKNFGDPCPGVKKFLNIQYFSEGQKVSKSFSEGSIVIF